MENVVCNLHKNGLTRYYFDVEGENSGLKLFSTSNVRGKGIVATQFLTRGSIVLSNLAITSIVCGLNKKRICMKCYGTIKNVVKVRSDCKQLSYCSNECMAGDSEFIDNCGSLIDTVYSKLDIMSPQTNNINDLQSLLVKLLYSRLRGENALDILSLETALQCEIHPDIEQTELKKCSKVLYKLINDHNSQLLESLNTSNQAEICDKLHKLLCALLYNAQPLPIPGVKGVQILCLFPTLSKLNHSCIPNAILQFGINGNDVVAYLRLLADVQPDEEICISYLNQSCQGYETRQELLKQGFLFSCECQLCHSQSMIGNTNKNKFDVDNKVIKLNKAVTSLHNTTPSVYENDSFLSVLDLADEILRGSNNSELSHNNSILVSVNDAAMLVLQWCQNVEIAKNSESSPLMVRACLLMCKLLMRCGGENWSSRIEFAVMCGQHAVKMKLSQELSPNQSNEIKSVLEACQQSLIRYYKTVNNTYSNELLPSDYLKGSGQLSEYYENLIDKCSRIISMLVA